MEEIKNFAVVWLSIVAMIQSAVFVLTPNDGRSMLESYGAAWARTLRAVVRFFVPGKSIEERKESVAVWAVMLLCLPGAFVAAHAFGRLVG